MKLINSKGRVLLKVVSATAEGIDERGLYGVMYQYKGLGCGGNVDIVGLYYAFQAIIADAPSAKVVGLLPEPIIAEEFRLELALRDARQKVFDDSSYEEIIVDLKTKLAPYWKARQDKLKVSAANRKMEF